MTGPVDEFVAGARYALGGLDWLGRRGCRRFVAGPLAVNVVVFALGGLWFFGALEDWRLALVAWLPDWLDWLAWLLWPLGLVLLAVVVYLGFTALANLIGSPFNGLLAERVWRLSGVSAPGPSAPLWRELVLAPVYEIRKLAGFAVLAVPVLLITVIPGVNVVSPLAWLAYGAWVLAAEYSDYPLSNAGIPWPRQRELRRVHRARLMGFGAVALGLTLVPIVNLLAMPTAVVGASLMWADTGRDVTGVGPRPSGL